MNPEPQRYRFVVASAEEAVNVLRKRFGTGARVVSVKQVEGVGLAKFLQAPKLEVIAEVPSEPAVLTPPLPRPAAVTAPQLTVELDPAPALRPDPRELLVPAVIEEPLVARPVRPPSEPRLAMLLRAGGIPAPLIARFRSRPDWTDAERLAPSQGLTLAAAWLREEFARAPRRELSERIAFIGTPGSGKTTALCKRLASEVFCQERRAAVLKLDFGQPNPGDGLTVYCAALGVPCARDVADVPALEAGQTLFIDVPGLPLNHPISAHELREALDMLFTNTRVMVINAAYDTALIKAAYDGAAALEATHVVFTHLDEVHHWGKLWEFILHPALTPLFLATGQNIAGECEPDVFGALLARTFPVLESMNPNAQLAAA